MPLLFPLYHIYYPIDLQTEEFELEPPMIQVQQRIVREAATLDEIDVGITSGII